MTLTSIFIVSLGGALGTFLRYALSASLELYGITIVNLIGCFAIGALLSFLSLKTSLSQPVYLFLTVGLLGGFTTFSAFSVETFYLIDSEKYINAFFYVLTSVLGGLLAFLIGRHLVRLIL